MLNSGTKYKREACLVNLIEVPHYLLTMLAVSVPHITIVVTNCSFISYGVRFQKESTLSQKGKVFDMVCVCSDYKRMI
jgi:hypothetical protein